MLPVSSSLDPKRQDWEVALHEDPSRAHLILECVGKEVGPALASPGGGGFLAPGSSPLPVCILDSLHLWVREAQMQGHALPVWTKPTGHCEKVALGQETALRITQVQGGQAQPI